MPANQIGSELPRFGLFRSFLLYGVAAGLFFIATRFAIPIVAEATGVETIVAWFIAASVCVFLPLTAIGGFILLSESITGKSDRLAHRLWLRPMNAADWMWTLLGGIVIIASTGLTISALNQNLGETGLTPEYMKFEPLGVDRLWILAAWIPFFTINIIGEEFIWRAVALPRQEKSFGRNAWLINAAGWALFHVAMPWQIIVTILPVVVVIPYVVQRRKNAWIGVILHALVNGPGFIALAFGFV